MLKQINRVITKFNKNLEVETKRAIIDAQRRTTTEWSRQLHKMSGLKKQADAKARVRKWLPEFKNGSLVSALIGVATGAGFALRKFAYSTKSVKTRMGKRKSVLSSQFGTGKILVPDVFVMEKNGNQFIANRKGKDRFPTSESKSSQAKIVEWGKKTSGAMNRLYMGLFQDNLTNRIKKFINK